jgi:hypothetical protein
MEDAERAAHDPSQSTRSSSPKAPVSYLRHTLLPAQRAPGFVLPRALRADSGQRCMRPPRPPFPQGTNPDRDRDLPQPEGTSRRSLEAVFATNESSLDEGYLAEHHVESRQLRRPLTRSGAPYSRLSTLECRLEAPLPIALANRVAPRHLLHHSSVGGVASRVRTPHQTQLDRAHLARASASTENPRESRSSSLTCLLIAATWAPRSFLVRRSRTASRGGTCSGISRSRRRTT